MPPSPRHLTAGALLFDMDGTVVDSTAVVETIWSEFADRFGIDVEELLAYSHGRRSPDTIGHYLSADHDAAEVTREQEARELTLLDGIVEIPGAGELLRSLSRAPIAVVTSAPRELAQARMRAAGIELPPLLVAAEDVEHGKPSPEGYLKAAAELGVDIAECVIFEDAQAGIEAGIASGARTVVVGELHTAEADGLERIPDFTGLAASYDVETKRIQLRR